MMSRKEISFGKIFKKLMSSKKNSLKLMSITIFFLKCDTTDESSDNEIEIIATNIINEDNSTNEEI